MLNLLLFIGCYLGGFVMAFASNPVWAFMLYQLVYFMSPLDRWWSYMLPSLSYSLFTVILMIVVYLKDFKRHQENRIFAVPQFKWMYFIALAYVATIFHAALPDANNFATVNFIKLCIIISIAYKLIDTDSKLNGVLAAYMAGAAYVGFLAFQVGRDATGRVENIGTVDSPDSNGIAAAIAPSLVLCIYYFWVSKRKIVKFAVAVAGALVANGIVLINSRGSFLAVILSVAYFLFFLLFSKFQRKSQKSSALGLIFLGLIAAVNVIDESAIQRFYSINQEEMTEEQETGATRMFFWVAAIDMAKDFPFGAGALGFQVHAPNYLPEGMDTGGTRNRSVHSSWFEALTETGYLGLFCLVAMLFSSFKSTKQCKLALFQLHDVDKYFKIVAIEAALLAFIVAMSFMNRFRAEILYWCVLFTACAFNIYVLKVTKNIGESASVTRPKL